MNVAPVPRFSVSNLPAVDAPWKEYRKTVPIKAIKIDGPFVVETSEGPLTCRDGYLAIDSRGYPYPIAKEEFESIYERSDM